MNSLSTWFARRLLVSPKSHSVINVISRVSMVAVGVPVAAMVILVSVFNGIDALVRGLYNDFDPDLLITPVEGKVFAPYSLNRQSIMALEGVAATSFVLEESALVEYRGRQATAILRGVDSAFARVVPIEKMIAAGEWNAGAATVGQGVAYNLGMNLVLTEPLSFYAPRRGSYSSLLPINSFSTAELPVGGVFALDADTDGQYILVPLDFARQLFDYEGRVSALMVRFGEGALAAKLQKKIEEIAGEEFTVLNRYEQKASMYRIMKYEKWAVFFIGLVVLVIASFSIVGSLLMLIIDKRAGIRTLGAVGAPLWFVRRVFVRQGMMIGLTGAVAGLVLGVAVCAVQQVWGVVPMPAASFLVDSYPVLLRPWDIAAICMAFVGVIYIITIFTVRGAISKSDLGL
ncbi:MAG: ABC transporter permease [Rikenellaceae bacterium]|jgi:lipoprotein-releasing system permease protein|nr:ABC transporter permease [Rikenellaceae bacterium]